MNPKLVESLVEAVQSLPPADYALFHTTLSDRMVRKTPGVAGGLACIRNTRIAVWMLISLQKQGVDEAELLHNFPGLPLLDLFAARRYYAEHADEIDQAIVDEHDNEIEGENPTPVLTIQPN
jgi:uncharacterized protein (DUF433 family)